MFVQQHENQLWTAGLVLGPQAHRQSLDAIDQTHSRELLIHRLICGFWEKSPPPKKKANMVTCFKSKGLGQ